MTNSWRKKRLLYGRWRRLIRWEYWPSLPVYLPLTPVFILNALRHRSLMVVTLANPGMPSGGFVEDSKHDILQKLAPSGRVAAFSLIARSLSPKHKIAAFDQAHTQLGSSYPIVLKPDMGERGRGVLIAKSRDEALEYITQSNLCIIVQEYIAGTEYGVFYERHPKDKRGKITGITLKGNTVISGDGVSTLEKLILSDPRAVCLAPLFLNMHKRALNDILPNGKKLSLNKLGTHSQGSLFLDHCYLHTAELEQAIDVASQHFQGFHIGRYDIRVSNEEDFKAGNNWKIVELNGVTSEPTHMYDPQHSLFHAWKCLAAQWTRAFSYGAANRALGHQAISLSELIKRLSSHRDRTTTS